ncbi:hypothetical protein [Terribacillus saccharophilus]|uniref:hypothetical protein n=1 Tax=Terribacillus saccharophilus TaxID=361277 RepID=UPI003D2C5B04
MTEVKSILWITTIVVFLFGNFTDYPSHIALFLGSLSILAVIYLTENITKRGDRK